MQRERKPRSIVVSFWLALIEALLVRYVRVDEEWVERARATAARGAVVFVLRNRSLIDFLCLRGLVRRFDLPPLGFVSGLSSLVFAPFWRWLADLAGGRDRAMRHRRLVETLEAGGSAVVFLRRPAIREALGSRSVAEDGIRLAVEAEAATGRPVLALPTVFLWGEQAMRRLPGSMDFLFGSNEYPRILRSLWQLLWHRSVHALLVGEALDIAALRAERRVSSDEGLAGVIRTGVGRQIEKLRRQRLGTLTKPSVRVKNEILSSPRLKAELRAIAAEEKIPTSEIDSRAEAIMRNLAADIRPRVLSLFAVVMAFVWRKIYTGINVRPLDIERMRSTVSRGPTLVLPCHKSHIDYMVVSQVMQSNNVMLPHIAAGENLSFWPLGWLFRSSGAFFIRRKFINDRFYTAVVNAYVRRMIHEGYAIEVFIEGGRSRTGKTLRPKLGMIEMALKAMAANPATDLRILPVYIGYERVIEERAYVRESEGASKQAESIKGLLRTTKVLLSRYGRLYVRMGETFSVGDVLCEARKGPADLGTGAARREIALATALRTLREINRISVATTSAVISTALLALRDKEVSRDTLIEETVFLLGLLDAAGAELSSFLGRVHEAHREDPKGREPLDRVFRIFVKAGRIARTGKGASVRYSIREGQRQYLDYYKNNIIHFLVPSALLAGACLKTAQDRVCLADIARDMALGCRLYHWEFMLDAFDYADEAAWVGVGERLAREAVALLERTGVVEAAGAEVVVRDRRRMQLLADLLGSFHEAYAVVLRAIRERATGEREVGDILRRARDIAAERAAHGELARPEALNKLLLQSAHEAFKDMKVARPAKDERPFDEGGLGDRLHRYLEDMLRLGRA